MSDTLKTKLNYEQIEALKLAKERLGRTWKAQLRQAWFEGRYPYTVRDIAPLLQQVRNTYSDALDLI